MNVKRSTLAKLKTVIQELEQVPVSLNETGCSPPLPFGLDAVDAILPSDGLALDKLHEVTGAVYNDMPAATAFTAVLAIKALALKPGAKILWCRNRRTHQEFGIPYGHGFLSLGLDPARIIHASLKNDQQVLWAMEEGLRADALAAVIGDVPDIDLTQSRRLSLAATAHKTPCFLIRSFRAKGSTAAETRWCVSYAVSEPDTSDIHAPGFPRWGVELTKNRGGRLSRWILDWNHEEDCFHLAPPLADRETETITAGDAAIIPLRHSA